MRTVSEEESSMFSQFNLYDKNEFVILVMIKHMVMNIMEEHGLINSKQEPLIYQLWVLMVMRSH
jgi:hypothetical protein